MKNKLSIHDMFSPRQQRLVNNAERYALGAPPKSPERQLYLIIRKYNALCTKMAMYMNGSDACEAIRAVQDLKIGEKK
jgi:hypothetical protein